MSEQSKEETKEDPRERWCRMLLPAALVVVVWGFATALLSCTKDQWSWKPESPPTEESAQKTSSPGSGEKPKDAAVVSKVEWAAVTLNSVVILGAFASVTIVSVAAMRRDW